MSRSQVPTQPVAAGETQETAAVIPADFDGWRQMTRTVAHYERLEQIGEGTYGQVYRARCLDTGRIVALKKMRIHHGGYWGMPLQLIREIKILKRLRHKNLLEMIEVVTSKGVEHLDNDDPMAKNHQVKDKVADTRESYKGNLFLVLEYLDHDLTGLLDVAYQFTPVQIKCIFKQLLEALAFMHQNKYVHRDIKSSNLLLDSNFNLKLADFGLARSTEAPLFDQVQERKASQMSVSDFTNKVITLWYRPPEILLGASQYGSAVDVWSAGCILAELILGKPLFAGKTELDQLNLILEMLGPPPSEETYTFFESGMKKAKSSDPLSLSRSQKPPAKLRPKYGEKIPLPALSLIEKMLAWDPRQRVRAADALKHKYFWTAPVAPDNPADLGETIHLGGPHGHFHEFQTKKKRKQAKGIAEEAKERARLKGATEDEAQAEYDKVYRKLMKKVFEEGLGANETLGTRSSQPTPADRSPQDDLDGSRRRGDRDRHRRSSERSNSRSRYGDDDSRRRHRESRDRYDDDLRRRSSRDSRGRRDSESGKKRRRDDMDDDRRSRRRERHRRDESEEEYARRRDDRNGEGVEDSSRNIDPEPSRNDRESENGPHRGSSTDRAIPEERAMSPRDHGGRHPKSESDRALPGGPRETIRQEVARDGDPSERNTRQSDDPAFSRPERKRDQHPRDRLPYMNYRPRFDDRDVPRDRDERRPGSPGGRGRQFPHDRPIMDERDRQRGRPPFDERPRDLPPLDNRGGPPHRMPYDDRDRPRGERPRDMPPFGDRGPPRDVPFDDRDRARGWPPRDDRDRPRDMPPFDRERERFLDRPPPIMDERRRHRDDPPDFHPDGRDRRRMGPPPDERDRRRDRPFPEDRDRPRDFPPPGMEERDMQRDRFSSHPADFDRNRRGPPREDRGRYGPSSFDEEDRYRREHGPERPPPPIDHPDDIDKQRERPDRDDRDKSDRRSGDSHRRRKKEKRRRRSRSRDRHDHSRRKERDRDGKVGHYGPSDGEPRRDERDRHEGHRSKDDRGERRDKNRDRGRH